MNHVLMVASAGGHLAELFRLRRRLTQPTDVLSWVTTDHPHSRSLLDGQRVLFVPNAPSRNLLVAIGNARRIAPFLRECVPDRIVSNGASLAVSTMALVMGRGIRCDYVENSVRVSGPSLSGRLVSWLPGVHTFTQYASWANRRWRVAGSLLDEWRATPAGPVRPIRRVVVTVGTEAWSFRSLFVRLASILRPDQEVLLQHGSTEVADLGLRGVHSLPAPRLYEAMKNADLVIAHAGIGSAIAAMDQGQAPLLVPRRASRSEAVDDHQVEIGKELARRGLCEFVDAEDLTVSVLERATTRRVESNPTAPPFDCG